MRCGQPKTSGVMDISVMKGVLLSLALSLVLAAQTAGTSGNGWQLHVAINAPVTVISSK